MDISEKETQLIEYFRSMSEFNRQRLLAMAAHASDTYRVTMKFKENQQRSKRKDGEA
jgi:hypothetical protein